jgi:peptide/nickel transport system ATP-binding protein
MTAVLSVENLSVDLPPGADRPQALRDVSFRLRSKEVLCLVGESGSGKSITAGAIMGLLPERIKAVAGRILFEGRNLLELDGTAMRRVRGAKIGMIFQEPMTALNPLMTVGDQLGEVFRAHTRLSRREIAKRTLRLIEDVQIPDPQAVARAYPHELSGGQRQRVMIAESLALEPPVLIADEPTTALDVTLQAQILRLIRELLARRGTAALFITHDFGVVAEIATRIAVMREGELVEQGLASQILRSPRQAYTRSLIGDVPPLAPLSIRRPATEPILRIRHARKEYRSGGLLRRGRAALALDDVSFNLPQGGVFGVVGESGSGKSTLARCIMRLLEFDAGSMEFEGRDITRLRGGALRRHSRLIQMAFQDPYASLNPRRAAGEQVMAGPLIHGISYREAAARTHELFELVGLDPAAAQRYPHEFSGGQRQRLGLARALALEPKVLIADEPVSALDVTVQAQMLRLLARLRKKLGLSLLFITHDLRVAAQICDFVAVMKDGRIVEQGSVEEVFLRPRNGYTHGLMAAIPGQDYFPGRLPDEERSSREESILRRDSNRIETLAATSP